MQALFLSLIAEKFNRIRKRLHFMPCKTIYAIEGLYFIALPEGSHGVDVERVFFLTDCRGSHFSSSHFRLLVSDLTIVG